MVLSAQQFFVVLQAEGGTINVSTCRTHKEFSLLLVAVTRSEVIGPVVWAHRVRLMNTVAWEHERRTGEACARLAAQVMVVAVLVFVETSILIVLSQGHMAVGSRGTWLLFRLRMN